MPYATQQDIVDRYGEDALFAVADKNDDGVIDTAAVARALDDATDEINTYLAKKYSLPLPTVPGILTRLAVDIALYRLSPDSSYTDEKRNRYDDVVRALKSLASGEASLGLPEAQTPNTSAGNVEVISSDRQFSRMTMGRLR